MRALVIGDLHFGIKSNSLSWLESQLKFFKDQIFVTIEEKNIDRIIFLGDVSDIRYSVNQQIGIELKKLFREMLNKFNDKEFIIVAGNHDYYSPLLEQTTNIVCGIYRTVKFIILFHLRHIHPDRYPELLALVLLLHLRSGRSTERFRLLYHR